MECSSSYQKENMKSEVHFEEPMDTNETQCDSNFEEGEIFNSDDENDIFDPKETSDSSIFTRKIKKDHGFVLGFNTFDESDASKKLNRAKRFALPINTSAAEISEEQLIDLYRDLGISKENERHYRFNTIHVRGVQNMDSEDVLEYFTPFSPSHVEWINDISCNVVWVDDISCARALLHKSKKIKTSEVRASSNPVEKVFGRTEWQSEKMNNDDFVNAEEIEDLPPGFWRIGLPSKKSPLILLRYASRSDKKQHSIDKISESKEKNTKMSSTNFRLGPKSFRTDFIKSKHKIKTFDSLADCDNSVDEKMLHGSKNPWVELAYEWGKSDKVEENDCKYVRNKLPAQYEDYLLKSSVPDLRLSLLNKKKVNNKRERGYGEESSNSSDIELLESRNKIPRMKMYADDEEKRLEKTVKNSHSNRFNKKFVKDLRTKINSKKNKAKSELKTDKREPEKFHCKSSNSENEYDDEDSGEWALEHYHDLRESLDQNKRREYKSSRIKRYKSESEDNEDDDDEENVVVNDDYDDDDDDDKNDSLINFGHVSPLQIEIDNDEYYQNLKNK